MPPDLNSVPRSPRLPDSSISSTSSSQILPPDLSRRTSSAMGPPPVPQNSSLPNSPRATQATMFDNVGVAVGLGPIRHPRPLTAAELHLELEKEQEGIVNRLTRELSQLRAQTASVASTTSTSSDLFTSDPYLYPLSNPVGGTTIIPTSARRHRSSSNLSTRSARSIRDAAQNATSVSGVAAPREQSVPNSSRQSTEVSRPDISRQNSISTSNQRNHSVPASPYISHSHSHSHRPSLSTSAYGSIPPPPDAGFGLNISNQTHPRSPSFNAAVAAARYEEANFHRAELDSVKRENEFLKQRIRDLEKALTGERITGGTQPEADGEALVS